jgi:hypothetical protein
VLRRILGPKRALMIGRWRKLHKEELHNLYPSPSIIRMMKWRRIRWSGHVAQMRVHRNAYKLLVGKPEGKRPLGGPRHMWMDNSNMNLGEVGWGAMDCISLTLVKAVMNLRVP